MKQTKVFQLIQLLSEKEWKALKKWLDSPWANTNKTLFQLYIVIEKGFPHFDHPKWSKENIYAKTYAQKAYNNKVFNNLLSSFYQQVKKFLIHQKIEQAEALSDYFFTSELMERGDNHFFESTTYQLIEQLETKPIKATKDYYLLTELYSQLYYQPNASLRVKPESMVLEKANQYLTIYHQLTHLRQQHDLKIRSAMLKQTPLLSSLEHPVILPIELLQNRINRPEQWGLTHYLNFKILYHQYFHELPKSYQQYFLFCCINDSVILSNAKAIDGIKELFEHYQFGFKHNLLLQYGQLTGISFNNIIVTASHLEASAFANNFFDEYHTKVEPPLKSDAYYWGKAAINCIDKRYEAAIDTIQGYSFSTELFKIQAIGVHLKAEFELFLKDNSKYDYLFSLCLAKEKAVQRSKIYSKARRINYIRFIQYLRRLITLVENPTNSTAPIISFLNELTQAQNFFGKRWLLEKLNSLYPNIILP